jgi:hypothetical protein
MPENVTGFRPTENLKKSLIGLAYFDMLTRRSPTFFREEPKKKPAKAIWLGICTSAVKNENVGKCDKDDD